MPGRGQAVLVGVLLGLGSVRAQAQGVIAGLVRADSAGTPLAGVAVIVEGTALKATTGPNGRYVVGAVPVGLRLILFRSIGHLPLRLPGLLKAGDTTRVNAVLIPSSTVLDPIVVTAREPRGEGREAFEERRRLGFGKFYDSTMMRKSEHLRLMDLLRRQGGTEPKTTVVDGQPAVVAFNPYRRSPGGQLNCPMQVYYNGVKVGEGGQHANSRRWFDLGLFDIASLESVEVYRSAGQVPGIYSGPTADCGVILLWSRQH